MSVDCSFSLADAKTEKLAEILSNAAGKKIRRLLVVGCGSGIETAVLSSVLNTPAVGIDIESNFNQEAAKFAELIIGDATRLEFADGSFDAVYSFHALEHIPDYRATLKEIRRVLSDDGTWIIGTPNRDRLIGYLGSKTATLSQKLRWNFGDWMDRLKGQFRNECGAHAGFTSEELATDLGQVFSRLEDVTLQYYLEIYPAWQGLIRGLARSGMGRWLFPAVYFVGKK